MINVFSELKLKTPLTENEQKPPSSENNSEKQRTPKRDRLGSPSDLVEDEKPISKKTKALKESPAKQKSPTTRGVTKKGGVGFGRDTKSPKSSLSSSLKKTGEYAKDREAKPEKQTKPESARLYSSGGSSSGGGAKAAPQTRKMFLQGTTK